MFRVLPFYTSFILRRIGKREKTSQVHHKSQKEKKKEREKEKTTTLKGDKSGEKRKEELAEEMERLKKLGPTEMLTGLV